MDASEEPKIDAAQQARISIRRTLHDLAAKVSSIDFASIGVFGLLLFTYAAVALANAAEHLFNRIYEAPSKSPAHLRLAIHWSILTLGAGLPAMSLYLSGQMVEWFGNMESISMLKPILTHCVSLLASWILLFLVYATDPQHKSFSPRCRHRISRQCRSLGASKVCFPNLSIRSRALFTLRLIGFDSSVFVLDLRDLVARFIWSHFDLHPSSHGWPSARSI